MLLTLKYEINALFAKQLDDTLENQLLKKLVLLKLTELEKHLWFHEAAQELHRYLSLTTDTPKSPTIEPLSVTQMIALADSLPPERDQLARLLLTLPRLFKNNALRESLVTLSTAAISHIIPQKRSPRLFSPTAPVVLTPISLGILPAWTKDRACIAFDNAVRETLTHQQPLPLDMAQLAVDWSRSISRLLGATAVSEEASDEKETPEETSQKIWGQFKVAATNKGIDSLMAIVLPMFLVQGKRNAWIDCGTKLTEQLTLINVDWSFLQEKTPGESLKISLTVADNGMVTITYPTAYKIRKVPGSSLPTDYFSAETDLSPYPVMQLNTVVTFKITANTLYASFFLQAIPYIPELKTALETIQETSPTVSHQIAFLPKIQETATAHRRAISTQTPSLTKGNLRGDLYGRAKSSATLPEEEDYTILKGGDGEANQSDSPSRCGCIML